MGLKFNNTSVNPLPAIEENSFKYLRAGFEQPRKEYAGVPFWIWHDKVTHESIDTTLLGYKENGFGGVIVHQRPGMITEYLSQDWFELFQYTVKKGKELDLDIWIYDENSYPTGFGGGHVPAEMPESYNQGAMLRMTKSNLPVLNKGEIFIALRKDADGSFTDVTKNLKSKKYKPGEYYLFHKEYYEKSDWFAGHSYVDLMVKGVTEKFIDVTMAGYEKTMSNEFGKTIKGLFSDEPSIQAYGAAGCIRWTPDLFSTFQQKWDYDLLEQLPSLFEETGDWRKVRHNYFQTLLDLFIDRWFKPMYAYAQKNRLIWTGHYWEHAWPDPTYGPDNMAAYSWHHQPGIDMLWNQFDESSPNAQFGNIRAVKELASVGNQLNKKRKLSETYGGSGWDLTFKDMKRLGDWEYALGVNFLNQCLSFTTLVGPRKYDYPSSFSYHNPWWPYYKVLNDYFTRLSFALSQGAQLNNILVIEPTTSAWMYAMYRRSHEQLKKIGQSFQDFVTTIEKAQVEYDLGSEYIIKEHGKVLGKQFVVGNRAYTTVVIPPGMENIDGATFRLLKEYAGKGGRVLQFEELQRIDGAVNTELSHFDLSYSNIKKISRLDTTVIKEYLQPRECKISHKGGNLLHQRRVFNDGQLLFLTNVSMTDSVNGALNINGKDALLMDLFTGRIYDYPERPQAKTVWIDFDIPPAGSMLLFIADRKNNVFERYSFPVKSAIVPAPVSKVIRPKENELIIDFCDVQMGNTVLKDLHFYTAADTVFKYHGFENGDPWNHKIQFKNQIVERDSFSKNTGFTATYRFTIDQQVYYKKFRAVVEQGSLWNLITINGQQVKPLSNQWWLDRNFAVVEIGPFLKPGENSLSLSVDPMRVYAEIQPIYILGDFNLATDTKGFRITPPQPLKIGSWKKQGMPLFSHSITYSKEISLNTIGQQYEVTLPNWKGTVVSVKVNNESAGIIFSEPGNLNITKYLKKGINMIDVTVTGSLKNLLGPHHKSPKPGQATPFLWRNISFYPPGNDYDTYDYGLFVDFEIRGYSLRK
ncbi:MAG: glycosyl hydrolase [Niabella sp.]